MSSEALEELKVRLADVGELIAAHGVITGRTVGRPARRQGGALVRAGTVLLCAAMEAFVVELFDEAVALMEPSSILVEIRFR